MTKVHMNDDADNPGVALCGVETADGVDSIEKGQHACRKCTNALMERHNKYADDLHLFAGWLDREKARLDKEKAVSYALRDIIERRLDRVAE